MGREAWASVLGPQPPITRCPRAQVAAEVLEEMCGQMGITDPKEVQEFALFLMKEEGELLGAAEGRQAGPSVCPWVGSPHAGAGAGPEWPGRLPTGTPLAGKLVRPLRPHEYLNNAAGGLDASLHSRRLSWETPLHFDNLTYISTHYSQVGQPHAALARECQRTPACVGDRPASLPARKRDGGGNWGL